MSVAKELIESLQQLARARRGPGRRAHREGRSPASAAAPGRTFRAKLKLEQDDEGKWRVEFDEEWAKEPPKGEAEEERRAPRRRGDAQEAEAAAAADGLAG